MAARKGKEVPAAPPVPLAAAVHPSVHQPEAASSRPQPRRNPARKYPAANLPQGCSTMAGPQDLRPSAGLPSQQVDHQIACAHRGEAERHGRALLPGDRGH